MRSTLAFALVILSGIGCVHTPENITLDAPPAGEDFDGGGSAEIVVVRTGIAGWAVSFGVWINDLNVGAIRSNDHVHHRVRPGPVHVKVTAEKPCEANFPAEANRRYYVKANVRMGWWYGRVQLEMIDPKRGAKAREDTADQTRKKPYKAKERPQP